MLCCLFWRNYQTYRIRKVCNRAFVVHLAVALLLLHMLPIYAQTSPQPLELDDALLEAYQANPTLRAAMAQEPVAEAGIVLAKQRLNPKASFQAAPLEATYHPVDLSIYIQLGLKRQKRIALAKRQIESTNALIRTTAWKIRQDTELAFFEMAVSKQVLSVLQEYLQIAERLQFITTKRLQARDVSGLDVLRADTAVADAKTQLAPAEVRVKQAQRQLNILLGRNPEAEIDVSLSLLPLEDVPPSFPDFKTLLSLAQQNRPEYRQFTANLAIEQARIKVARSARWPDIQVGAGISSVPQTAGVFSGSNFRYGPFGYLAVPIPINDHQQGPEAIARSSYQQILLQREAFSNQMEQELNLSFSNLQAAEKQLRVFITDFLPKQKQVVVLTEKGYSAGVIDLTTALTAQQVALTARVNFLLAVTRYFQARVEVERAVGKPLIADASGGPKSK